MRAREGRRCRRERDRPAQSGVAGRPPGGPPRGSSLTTRLSEASQLFIRQREATVFVVVVAAGDLLRLHLLRQSTFFTKLDIINITQIAAPIIIIAIGEVLLLICGEIDLSRGLHLHLRAVPHALPDRLLRRAGCPGDPAGPAHGPGGRLVQRLLHGDDGPAVVHHHARHRVHPATASCSTPRTRSRPVPVPAAQGIGHWIGTYAWAEIIWAIILVVIFHIVLTRTRWGLHTIATGGNRSGPARRASGSAGSSTATS